MCCLLLQFLLTCFGNLIDRLTHVCGVLADSEIVCAVSVVEFELENTEKKLNLKHRICVTLQQYCTV